MSVLDLHPWQVRAWGRYVLARVRAALAGRYPVYAEFQALAPGGPPFEARPLALLAPDERGETDAGPLNDGFDAAYLADPRNPRWVAKPTVAYLWARTVRCKGCRAVLPLLKTRWLCKKDSKRVLLAMTPKEDGSGVDFGVEIGVSRTGGNAAQQREHDKRLGAGTMTRSGARCPCCLAIMTMEDIRLEGRAGRLGAVMTAVVVDGPKGKEYRLPEDEELRAAEVSAGELEALYADIPFGLPEEPLPGKEALGFRIPLYGFDRWAKLFTDRQLLALGSVLREIRRCADGMEDVPEAWREAIMACLVPSLGRLADRGSALATWTNDPEKIRSTFARFALPVVWDFAESCPLTDTTGGFIQAVEWIARVVEHLQGAAKGAPVATVLQQSATDTLSDRFDVICTDPPYYDAIPYSDLMDFFHVWLRRALHGVMPEAVPVFADPLGPKWNAADGDGELIDDASRFGGDRALSKQIYEDGMARAFERCHEALNPEGRLVVVFANKSPDAWETLVAALIRAGFVVTGSWPIRTEMQNRQRSLASAALASSVWLVCRKRPPARPGWDRAVLSGMRENITRKLRDFWDAGIRGPDFVWAATGPALEAFSRHPAVRKADDPGALLTVSEFLREVRRMVVDFVVGRVLTADGDADAASGLDDVTTYYLLHRGDFGLGEAPAGACILYALSCNLSDRDLSDRFAILARPGRALLDGLEDDEPGDEEHGEFVLMFAAVSERSMKVRALCVGDQGGGWTLDGAGIVPPYRGPAGAREPESGSCGHERPYPARAEGGRAEDGWERGRRGQPGAGAGAALSVILSQSSSRLGFLARVRMVSATASPRALMRPMAKRRSRVMFSGPWPERIRLRSSSKLQSRMWWVASMVQCPRWRASRRCGGAAPEVRLVMP